MRNTAQPPEALAALLDDLPSAEILLRISQRTLRRMAAVGSIPGVVRVGRRLLFRHSELVDWVNRGCPAVRLSARGRK
jgi:excisionase family DNA binding protein